MEQWAAARGLAELSFWNVQDDNTAGSHVKKNPYEYSHIFEPFTSSAVSSTQSLAAASSVAQHGNFRSLSCPSATFCMAVDGNGNALRFDGHGWTAPAGAS